MKRILGLTMMLMIGCAAGAALRDVVAPARAQGQTGPSYEYAVVRVINYEVAQRSLSQYGQAGWRLAAATGESAHDFIFERALPGH